MKIFPYLLIIYEFIQIFLFKMAQFIFIFFTSYRARYFIKLRSKKMFSQKVLEFEIEYLQLKKTNINCVIYWIHVSSAGELEQAIPVARFLHEKMNAYFFVTYYSASAEPFLKNFPALLGCAGLPIDIRSVYNKLIQKIPIEKIFFVRYDIWPSLLYFCSSKKIQLILMSASKSKTKKGFFGFLSTLLNQYFYQYFNFIFAVSKKDTQYFKEILKNKPIQIIHSGDAKWSRALERVQIFEKLNSEEKFKDFVTFCHEITNNFNRKIIVVGSPHIAELNIISKLFSIKEKFFIICVPHKVDENTILNYENQFKTDGFNIVTYSNWANFSNQNATMLVDIILFDKIGYLSEIYSVANICLIGGGFDGQIHNVLESAAHGIPTIFGPNFKRAREAHELVEAKAALSFESEESLFHFLSSWVNFENESSPFSDAELQLLQVRENSMRVFQNIPNTSEVIFASLSHS